MAAKAQVGCSADRLKGIISAAVLEYWIQKKKWPSEEDIEAMFDKVFELCQFVDDMCHCVEENAP